LWLQQNAARFGIDEGYLFGSVTQPGRFTQHSDVDVAIESIAAGQPFGLLSYLSTHLDREVDVVPLDQCHFADKIARPDSCGTRTNWRLTRPKPLNVMVSKIPISIY
ncbi:MAG: nucleotidyltransferase domain-containing protein, partial [Leptolyngbyaceae cyanobacterium RM2_2_21]|nr:nucleotidyltransferase domain-containing protein [Leptolyngbyaceae cyanobacterium RM2_2_21]